MKIAMACDHGAVELKNKLKAHLQEKGMEVVDFGTHTTDSCDYPDYIAPASVTGASSFAPPASACPSWPTKSRASAAPSCPTP